MPLPPDTLVFAALVVAGAFVIFGVTGFGSTIIAVPLLAHVLPLKFVIPMFVLLDFAAALRTGFKFHSTIAVREFKWLVPCMFAGIAVGVFLLVSLPGEAILLALGVFVFGYGAYAASGREPTFRLGRLWALPVGAIGGMISALFGAAGPLYVIYLGARGLDPGETRATMAVVFIITTGTRIVLFALAGLFAQDGVLDVGRRVRGPDAGRTVDRSSHARESYAPAPLSGDRRALDPERRIAHRARARLSAGRFPSRQFFSAVIPPKTGIQGYEIAWTPACACVTS